MTVQGGGRSRVESATTALFVPSDRPDRFDRAAAEADIAIFDLEDSVDTDRKGFGRNAVVSALDGGQLAGLVRINPTQSEHHLPDLALIEALTSRTSGLLGLVVPKVETSAEVRGVVAHVGTDRDVPIVALIESAKGVMNALAIAAAPGVVRLAFGAVDYSLDVGCSLEDEVLAFPRSVLVNVSRVAKIAGPLNSPSLKIHDVGAVARDAVLARSFGFTGQLCIHPAQVRPVSEAFEPSAEEYEWARKVFALESERAQQLDGMMIDAPLVEKARRILASMAETDGFKSP